MSEACCSGHEDARRSLGSPAGIRHPPMTRDVPRSVGPSPTRRHFRATWPSTVQGITDRFGCGSPRRGDGWGDPGMAQTQQDAPPRHSSCPISHQRKRVGRDSALPHTGQGGQGAGAAAYKVAPAGKPWRLVTTLELDRGLDLASSGHYARLAARDLSRFAIIGHCDPDSSSVGSEDGVHPLRL